MERKEAIKALEYLISGECTDSAMDYADEIRMAIVDMKICEANNALAKDNNAPCKNVGKWTTERTVEHGGEWYCSHCGYEPIVMSDDMEYCPGCGYKMEMPKPPKEGT